MRVREVLASWARRSEVSWEDVDRVADSHNRQRQTIGKLTEALRQLVDYDECRHDHNGNCQTHGINNPCSMAIARDVLAKVGG